MGPSLRPRDRPEWSVAACCPTQCAADPHQVHVTAHHLSRELTDRAHHRTRVPPRLSSHVTHLDDPGLPVPRFPGHSRVLSGRRREHPTVTEGLRSASRGLTLTLMTTNDDNRLTSIRQSL